MVCQYGEMTTPSQPAVQPPRSRYRAQVRQEIKEAARRQLAEGGAGSLSLNAIARDMGMRGPSLYRYFDSRDALVTDLLLDALHDVNQTLREATTAPGQSVAERLSSAGRAYRRWALAHPEMFDLIYGRPLPGYQAPPATGAPARETLMIIADLVRAGRSAAAPAPAPDDGAAWRTEPVPSDDEHVRLAVRITARLHGLITLELHGHLGQMVPSTEALYEEELRGTLAWALGRTGAVAEAG